MAVHYVWKYNWTGLYYPMNIPFKHLKARKRKEYMRRCIRTLWLPGCREIRDLYDDWRYENCKYLWEQLNHKKYNYIKDNNNGKSK